MIAGKKPPKVKLVKLVLTNLIKFCYLLTCSGYLRWIKMQICCEQKNEFGKKKTSSVKFFPKFCLNACNTLSKPVDPGNLQSKN